MASFDVVSEVDVQEVRNAIDQAQRELATRFDFKGTDSSVEFKDNTIQLESASEERLKAAAQVLEEKIVRRKVSLKALDYGKVEEASKGARARRLRSRSASATRRRARSASTSRVSGSRACSIRCRPTSSRVTGKKRDDLQKAIASLREHDFGVPLDFTNFRD